MARRARKQNAPEMDEPALKRLQAMARQSPFLIRFTRWKDVSPPVLVVKERIAAEDRDDVEGLVNPRARTVDRGVLHGPPARAVLPVLRRILANVKDEAEISLGLDRFVTTAGLDRTDVNLPLDDEAGAKLSLFFKLQANIQDVDRIELIGRRIASFSREESVYWLSNATVSDPVLSSWAVRGLRMMLCGEAGDPRIETILARVRARG